MHHRLRTTDQVFKSNLTFCVSLGTIQADSRSPILTSHFDSTFTFESSTSFCQYLSVIVFDLCHLFCKKVRLQGFIKKFIIPEPSEINN
jgi:hypothetical protein